MTSIWKLWPACQTCNGNGIEYGEACIGCGGSGRDPECCIQCEEKGLGFDDDGQLLCRNCLWLRLRGTDNRPSYTELRNRMMALDKEAFRLVEENERLCERVKELEAIYIAAEAHVDRLRAALKECSEDLAAYVEHQYAKTLDYPSQKRRYDRDMQSVLDAQHLLEQSTKDGK